MKYGFIKTATATPDVKVADVKFNTKSIIDTMKRAWEEKTNLLVLPELCITGYSCGDLFNQSILVSSAMNGLIEIAAASEDMDMLTFVGLPVRKDSRLYDCAAAIYNGEILAVIPKRTLSNYGESYEMRNFSAGQKAGEADIGEALIIDGMVVPFGTGIILRHSTLEEFCVGCEIGGDLYAPVSPSVGLAQAGATIIANPSASCEIVSRDDYRRLIVSAQSSKLICGYAMASAGEGESTQDGVFTGHDIISEYGTVLADRNMENGIVFSEIDVKKLTNERIKTGFGNSGEAYIAIEFGLELRETELTRHINKLAFIPETDKEKTYEKVLTLQALALKKRFVHTYSDKLVVGVSGGLDSTLAMIICAKTLKMLGRKPTDLIAVTMPCFGTTKRTRSNAELLAEKLGAELKTVNIAESVAQHFKDIGHDINNTNVVFENAQARERTQVIMDIANGCNGMVIGTGDLSEISLGWATYNGDHMSMYGVNADITKTLVRQLVSYYADTCGDNELKNVLMSIVDTPVSPELLPAKDGEISQKTEDLVGPYELHDFFLYNIIRWGFEPSKVFYLAKYAFEGEYSDETILKWLRTFCRRFFIQQFKRSCIPDGPKVGSVALSPRGDWRMPTDAISALWLEDLENL